MANTSEKPKTVFWHRELPPLDGEPIEEHVLEAMSDRVGGRLERSGDSWQACYESLMGRAASRLEQELLRLGGHYAHVLDEHVESHRDDVTNESWLKGQFSYVLYRRVAR